MAIGHDYSLYIGLRKGTGKTFVKNAVTKIKNLLTKEGIIAYTQVRAKGYWKGVSEPNIIVSFVNTYNMSVPKIISVVNKIKRMFSQEAVLLVKDRIRYKFV